MARKVSDGTAAAKSLIKRKLIHHSRKASSKQQKVQLLRKSAGKFKASHMRSSTALNQNEISTFLHIEPDECKNPYDDDDILGLMPPNELEMPLPLPNPERDQPE